MGGSRLKSSSLCWCTEKEKLDPVPRVNSCPGRGGGGGFSCCVKLDSSYQVSKIAEIVWVNQQGALEKQLDPGR